MHERITVTLLASLATFGACNSPDKNATPTSRVIEPAAPSPATAQPREGQRPTDLATGEVRSATQLVDDAAATLRTMMTDTKLTQLVNKSAGVFIVPKYIRAAGTIGGRGGEGVLLAHEQGKWSDPVFYNLAGVSVGAQFGAETGQVAMLLMGPEALSSFKSGNTFSLNAGSKFTSADYSTMSRVGTGRGQPDVIFWSDTQGAFVGAALSATNVSLDHEEIRAYYGKPASAQDIIAGHISDEKDGPLQQALSSLSDPKSK